MQRHHDNGSPRFAVGVDLGTTNTAVAYVRLDRVNGAAASRGSGIEFFEIPQLVAPAELGHAPVLPSFLYLPGPYDLPEGSLSLPWDAARDHAVGLLARQQGAKLPGHLVASAKSWLSHEAVDRTADILPWRAPHDVEKISPVEASARLLRHVREGWNHRMATGDDANRFERQLIILTVPASFDEVARELTVEAAKTAGIPNVVLLEEPLAAFYAWLDGHAIEEAAADVHGRLVLVCDVGGGTSDFSVIGIRSDGLRFDRLAVGDHLMLGGDNMDHALGRHVETQIAGAPGRLDVQRWHQLVHQCRQAKEMLLEENAPDEASVAVSARGSRLIAETLSGTLRRGDVEQLVLEGFFPETTLEAPLQSGRRSGLMELGLPYEPDPAITRHVAAFWRRFHALLERQTDRERPRPDFILFNGGVFTPVALRKRVRGIIGSWFGGCEPVELAGTRLDLAVAHGAAYYGLVRLGARTRVRSGSPRAYYVGIEAGMGGGPAQPKDEASHRADVQPDAEAPGQADGQPQAEAPAPGDVQPQAKASGQAGVKPQADADAKQQAESSGEADDEQQAEASVRVDVRPAVCIVPRGAEEGFEALLDGMPVEALTNQPVVFHLFSSSTRTGDAFGELVYLPRDAVHPLPPTRTVLRFGRKAVARSLPVELGVRLTEVGTLQLWCQSLETDHRWELAFDLRQGAASEETAAEEARALLLKIESAQSVLRDVFEADPSPGAALWTELEEVLGESREAWSIPILRRLADVLLKIPRDRSAAHEAAWFDFLGYALRPGYGDPADEWRLQEVWKQYLSGLHFSDRSENAHAWWLFWRRVGGGLPSEKQAQVYYDVRPYIQQTVRTRKQHPLYPRRLDDREKLEAWKTLATFEKLPSDIRGALGQIVVEQLQRKASVGAFWALARLGVRRPIYGPLDRLVPGEEVGGWLKTLLGSRLPKLESVAYTLVHLAQRTGDRSRDIPEGVRQQVVGRLRRLPKSEVLVPALEEPGAELPSETFDWLVGEPLPPVGTALPQRSGILYAEERSQC